MTETWARYNCIDSAVTFKVWNTIKEDLKIQGHDKLYRDTMDLYEPIIFMQTIGLDVDREALEVEKERVKTEIKLKEIQLNAACGFDLNVDSPKQCQQYFYGLLGHTPYKGPRGNITTDDKALARLVRKGVKEAKYVQEIRTLRKLLGTYLEVALDPDGKIRSSFNPRGTTTGRLSSSQTVFGTGLNFQNLHPQFKGFIKAGRERFLISMDKSKAEWVITAYICQDPRMIEAIESGKNVHAVTASQIFGVPEDLVFKEYDLLGKTTDADILEEVRREKIPEIFEIASFVPRSMTIYQGGKKTNHGCNYVMSPPRFSLENEIPLAESKLFVNGYQETYINLPIWWEKVKAKLAKNRTLENCFGHKRRFLDAWGPDLFKAAIAYAPQSTSVWVVNYAMIKTYKDPDPFMDDLQLHAQVHDELLLSYSVNDWRNAAKAIIRVEEHMNPVIEYEGSKFRIGTDLAVGINWGDQTKSNLQGMSKVKLTKNETELADILEATYADIK